MTWTISKLTALGGALLLAIGAFLPLVVVPKRGGMSMMAIEGGWGGYVVLALAAASAALALLGRTRWAALPGVAALALLAYAFIRASTEIERARLRLGEGIGDDPIGQIRNLVRVNSTYGYGWAVLVIGALALVVAGALAWREGRRSGDL